MWKSILAMLLMPALTAAQTAQPPTALPTQSGETTSSPAATGAPAWYKPYAYYDGIRRGTSEEVSVEVSPLGYVTSPRSPVPDMAPLKIELQPVQGLSLTGFRYPKPFQRTFQSRPDPIPVIATFRIRFKVRASETAELGMHVLKGTLTFQPIDSDAAVGPVQKLQIEIPLLVVDHDAKVQRGAWPYSHLPVAFIVLMIVLFPLMLLLLPVYMLCMMAGKCD